MAKKITSMQQKRGYKDNLPVLKDAEFGFCMDTGELFIGRYGNNESVKGSFDIETAIPYFHLSSPNGEIFKLSISNDGAISIVKVGDVEPPIDPPIDPPTNAYEGLIINQVYGGGIREDNNTSVSHSFIELYNTTDRILNLSKLSVQIFNANESVWQKKELTGFIYPKHSYLIRMAQHSSTELPTTKVAINNFDTEWDVVMYNKGVKVVLLENKELLTGTNPFEEEIDGYIDMVGAGDLSIDGSEGNPILGQSKQKSVRRINFQDTDDNATDFEIVDFRNIGNEGNVEFNKVPRWIAYGSWDENDVYDPGSIEENPYEGLIINQVYGGGGEGDNSTAVSHSFIELYNKSDKIINLNGLSLQWSMAGDNWNRLVLEGSIPPKHSFLVRGGQHSDPSLPVVKLNISNSDLEWNTFIYNKGIKVVLIKGVVPLTGIINPFNIDGSGTKVSGYIDMFGIAGNDPGVTIDGCESEYGTGSETGQSKQKSFRRKEFQDTDNNLNDFELLDWRLFDQNWNKAPRWLEYGAWDVNDVMPDPNEGEEDGADSNYLDSYFEGLIINQVYGGGSYMDGATSVTHSFVELYNNSNHNIDLTNCSLQYAIKGTDYDICKLQGIIPPKHSFLVRGMQHNTYDSASAKLTIEDHDQEWQVLINNKGVKMVLMSTTKKIEHINPADIDGSGNKVERYIDMLGCADIASGTDGFEGGVMEGQSKQKAVRRKNFQDTSDNTADFEIVDFRDEKKAPYFPRTLNYGAWDESDLIFNVPIDEVGVNNLVMRIGDNEDERVITWHTTSDVKGFQLSVNSGEFMDQEIITSNVTNIDMVSIYCHKVILSNLRDGYMYSYKIQTSSGWSDAYTFNMPVSTNDDFGFIHLTDTQSVNAMGYQAWADTLKKAVIGFNGDFIVHTGDMVQNASQEHEWRGFFNFAKEDLTGTTMIPVLGNNDMVGSSSSVFERNFALESTYYSFDYRNTHFIVLDSNKNISEQLTWLANDLSTTNKKWKIVCMHEAPYMVTETPISKPFTTLFDQYGVDLVICGHKHTYVRTHKIKADALDETGTLYVMSNASALKQGEPKAKLSWHDVNIEPGRPSYITYTISSTALTLNAVKIEGDDSITIDTYTLTK